MSIIIYSTKIKSALHLIIRDVGRIVTAMWMGICCNDFQYHIDRAVSRSKQTKYKNDDVENKFGGVSLFSQKYDKKDWW